MRPFSAAVIRCLLVVFGDLHRVLACFSTLQWGVALPENLSSSGDRSMEEHLVAESSGM